MTTMRFVYEFEQATSVRCSTVPHNRCGFTSLSIAYLHEAKHDPCQPFLYLETYLARLSR
jgi:hypothetical protein